MIDVIAILILFISSVLAYARGFLRELLSIFSWVAAGIAAFIFAPHTEPLIKEIPGITKIIDDSCELSTIIAGIIIFAIGLIFMAIITPLFTSTIRRSSLNGIDQIFGFLFGIARGGLIIILTLILYQQIIGSNQNNPLIDDSYTQNILSGAQSKIETMIPQDASNQLQNYYLHLTRKCNETENTPN